MRKVSANRTIIASPGHFVKARIVAASIKFGALARAARISQPSLSNYLNGSRRDRHTQLKIWDAYIRLADKNPRAITPGRFWGKLLSKRMAG